MCWISSEMTAKRLRTNSPGSTPPKRCPTDVAHAMSGRGEAGGYLSASPVLPSASLLTPSPPPHMVAPGALPTPAGLLGEAWVTVENGAVAGGCTAPVRSPFEAAAAAGAEAAAAAAVAASTGTNGGTQCFTLGLEVVRSARLAVAQRRSARVLPGGGDTTTAACFALGGLPDATVTSLLEASSPAAPRDARLKVVERALKARVREHIVRLNGSNSKDMRASNLAAVRICTVAADILAAYAARSLVDELHAARVESSRKDAAIAALQSELAAASRCQVCSTSHRPAAPSPQSHQRLLPIPVSSPPTATATVNRLMSPVPNNKPKVN